MNINNILEFFYNNKIIILLIAAYVFYTKIIDPVYIMGGILIYYCYMISYNMEKLHTNMKQLNKKMKNMNVKHLNKTYKYETFE